MAQYNCIEKSHTMTEWASIPTNSRIIKDPNNRTINHGQRDSQETRSQIK